jgi:hypothetical protein
LSRSGFARILYWVRALMRVVRVEMAVVRRIDTFELPVVERSGVGLEHQQNAQ